MTRDLVRRGRRAEESEEVVRFTYNRFGDHLLARGLLDRHLDLDDPAGSFAVGTALGSWLEDARAGTVEAVTSLLPERTGLELLDVIPEAERDQRGRWYGVLLLDSLVSRSPDSISERTFELARGADRDSGGNRLFDVLCQIAPDPAHPLGGDLLHRSFARLSLAPRDRVWGSMLYDAGEGYGALARLLRWAERGSSTAFDPRVIEACCVPLAWLLSTPNRWVRDRATKALAAVLSHHLDVAARLVERFAAVDDPFLLQRLAIAAHGAVLLAVPPRVGAPRLLGVMQQQLLTEERTPDLLVRDAVAGVADRLYVDGVIDQRARKRARRTPATKPLAHPRTRRALDKSHPSVPWDQPGIGHERLWSAIDGPMGDRFKLSIRPVLDQFTRLARGSRIPGLDEFRSVVRIDKAALDRFLSSLRPDQRAEWGALSEAAGPGDGPLFLSGVWRLDDKQHRLFLAAVQVTNETQLRERKIGFDEEWVKRWLFQRAISYGWTPEGLARWGVGERWSREGRAPRETWADKYVLMALHELYARLVDHHQMRERWGAEPVDYAGPWQLNLREVDPTLPPGRVALDEDGEEQVSPPLPPEPQDAWWIGHTPGWRPREPVADDWGARAHDLPSLARLLRVQDADGRAWIRIHGQSSWDEPEDETAAEPSFSLIGRDLGYDIDGYLVEAADLSRLLAVLRGRRPTGERDAEFAGDAYLYECPWAQHAHSSYWEWDTDLAGDAAEIRALSAAGAYGWSGGSDDASLPETVRVVLPHEELRAAGGLERAGPSEWRQGGRVVLRDVHTEGTFRARHRGLLADEAWLTATLTAQRWGLVINVVGEKNLSSGAERAPLRSWLLFGAAIGWDGSDWDNGDWMLRPHPPGQIEDVEFDQP